MIDFKEAGCELMLFFLDMFKWQMRENGN